MKGEEAIPDDVLLARAGWLETADRILAGLCHDLNGRAAALRGFLQLKAFGDGPTGLEALLEDEIERLERLARTLSALPDRHGREAEMLAPGELLRELLELHEKHRGLETIETELEVHSDTPPLRASRRRVQRALLVMVGEVAWSAFRRGGRSVRISCAPGEGGGVGIDMRGASAAGAAPLRESAASDLPAPRAQEVVAPLRDLLARDGARLESVDQADGLRLRLTFPPL